MSRYSGPLVAAAALLFLPGHAVQAQARHARILGEIDDTKLVRLPHATHPLARAAFDHGRAPANLRYDRMLIVLKPSPEREAALEALLAAQQDPSSSQYHKWLTPDEFGARFGAADQDIATITGWLQGHGFQIGRVANAHNVIEFSGTAAQVEQAFHTEIHSYVVNGQQHWANASDPEIPAAMTSVVGGVVTLHNFRKASQISTVKSDVLRAQAGIQPNFTGSGGVHALAPGDFAAIYNVNPLYGKNINGAGTTIAVVARSNISMSDIQSFKNAFGVPNSLPQVVVNGIDPGDDQDGDEAEAVLDASWSAALAPNASVKLVVSKSTNTTDGVDLSEEYIIDNNLADVMTESYGTCEATATAAGQFYSALAQQAAAQGITYTVASGDNGAQGCDDPSLQLATGPKSVNLLAATPYNVAVGGTQFNENGNSSYWSSSNLLSFQSALSYIPEVVWNESCTRAQCGSNAGLWAGGGGASILFGKPSWQSGVLGVPSDGARDLPDISLSSAGHDFYLLCLDGSCTQKLGRSTFSGISGTSAATPAFAAIMALVVQQTGSRQGQAAATLYKLAAGENFSLCSATTPAANCIFNDVVVGNNAVPGEAGYGTANASYQAGVGYDLATGLGSVNVYNLAAGWSGVTIQTPQIRTGIDSPSSLNSTVIGLTTFSGWALATAGNVKNVAIAIDSVPFGTASYGAPRSDVCLLYKGANCPNIGWSIRVDSTLLANGPHQLDVTVTSSTGDIYTSASSFTVANWTTGNPMKINIDTPGSSTQTFSGSAHFAGWAVNDLAAVTQVSVAIDGVSYGQAQYGGDRTDVCNALPGHAGCPNVGWNASIDTTTFADGPHTFSVTAQSAGGQYATVSRDFLVANTPGNPIYMAIDTPAVQSGAFSGGTGFGGWAIGTTVPVSSVTATIDGLPYGFVQYGGTRNDVCASHAGAPGCPNVGWNLYIDTTQFVNGAHVLQIRAATAAGQFAIANRMFTVSNGASASPLLMSIDAPNAQNWILLGQTTFAGWAGEAGGKISRVDLAIDGAPQGTTSYGANRPDVCAAYPALQNCPDVGWSYAVDTSQLASGSHTATITVTAKDGKRNTLSTPFTVANWTSSNPMTVTIDRPNAQMGPLSGIVGIGGWAIDQLAVIDKVSIAVDNLSLGSATYGGNRSDVCAVVANAFGCPNVGWNFVLDTTLLSDGVHTLAVTGTTAGGQSSTFTTTFQVSNASATPVHMNIDIPNTNQTLTGTAHVGGWALDTSGAQILSVSVLVDNVLSGLADYGGVRTDVCASVPNVAGCPNVGWNYMLDTAPFANGSHTLQIRALAADGQKYTASQVFVVANQP